MLVDKPSGVTSHDVVDVVRRSLRTRKVGHAGTLDPMATGLLILGVGRATRLLRYLGDLPKSYAATGRLGEETDTLDADGQIVRSASVDVSRAEIERACAALVGDSLQTPPAYSAVKVGGRKLYEAARKGDALEAARAPDPRRRVRGVGVRRARRRGSDHLLGRHVRTRARGRRRSCARLRRAPRAPSPNRDRALPGRGRSPARRGGRRCPSNARSGTCRASAWSRRRHGRHRTGASWRRRAIDGPYAVFGPDDALKGIYRDDGAKARPEVVLASD